MVGVGWFDPCLCFSVRTGPKYYGLGGLDSRWILGGFYGRRPHIDFALARRDGGVPICWHVSV
jgi:hypothetical protein